MLMIVAATIICLAVILSVRDVAYSLVIIWALIGIAVKQGDRSQIVAAMAVAMALVIPVALIVVKLREARARPPDSGNQTALRDSCSAVTLPVSTSSFA